MPSQSAFTRHLSYFSSPTTGTITPLSSLRSALALGLDFPVACAWSLVVPLMYGNSGGPSIFPFSLFQPNVTIAALPAHKHRTMLTDYRATQDTYTRGDIVAIAGRETNGWVDWLHVVNLWTLAAEKETGLVSKRDFELFQRGQLLDDLARRRRVGRSRWVVPTLRGGPIWVGGHSWFVGKLFGVDVYKVDGNGEGKNQ